MKRPLKPALLLLSLLPGCNDDRSLVLWLANRPEKPTLEAVEHDRVLLSDLLAAPERWLNKGVRFDCLYHGPSGLFTPVYTRFSAVTHAAFSVWIPDARLWEPGEYASDFPLCYADRRDPALLKRLDGLKAFDRIEVRALVTSCFGGKPHLRVDALRRRGSARFETDDLRRIHEALTLAEEERWEDGADAARAALSGPLPEGADAELRKALGLCLLESGDSAAALPELQRAAQANPGDVDVLKWEGRAARDLALSGSGRHAESVAFLEAARKADPEDAEIPLILCEAYAAAGRPADALRAAGEAVEMNPLDADAYRVRAALQDAQGDLEGSAASYKTALELDGSDGQSWIGLARVQAKQGDFQGAAHSFEVGFSQPTDGDSPDDHYLAGRCYQSMGQPAPARMHYEQALQEAEWEGAADTHAALGEMAFQAEDWAGAEKAYETALGIRPKDAELLGCLGMARLRSGKFPEARKALEESLDRGVGKPGAAGEALAKACIGEGDLPAARKAVERACREEETAERRFLEGEIDRRLLRPKDASRAFARAVELDPKDTDAWLNLGIVRTELERYEEADQALAEAARLEPENPFVQTTQAYVLLVQGKEGALPPAEKAFARIPENPDAAHTYGWALLAAGRAAEALPVLQTAAAAGDVPQVQYHLAQAWAEVGKPQEARPLLQALVDARGDYAREARTLLRSLPEPEAPAP